MRSKEAVKSPLRGLIGGPWMLLGMVLLSGIGVVLALLKRRRVRENPPEVVAEVDHLKYSGVWYEIARTPSWFERDCVASTATYELMDNGKIGVINRCRVGTLDGPEREAHGVAWVPDPEQPAKLKVRIGLWPFPADYWIVQLGPKYSYSVVVTPDRSHTWILSRMPSMDARKYQDIVARLELAGFNTERLTDTLQPLEEEFFGVDEDEGGEEEPPEEGTER